MKSPFLSVEGCNCYDQGDGSYTVIAHGRIDSDGTGQHHGDRTAQNQTTYQPNLNADTEAYVVVPPQFRLRARGVVMGCAVVVQNLENGKVCHAVVGDSGPTDKWGEMSCACASLLGLNPSPVDGGSNARTIRYTYYPGIAAKLALGNSTKTYRLQPA